LREADELKTEQQYIDYFASVKVDVAPGQFTLEQLRDLKAKYEDLHAYSERDLSTIPEPDLLSDATPIPLGKASSGGPARHNSDTGWGKTLNWVDNHQILTSIGIGALAGISVALILLTAGTATPLVAAAWIGGTALATGAGIAGGTAALNSYFNRDWKQGILRNALIGAGIALITGGLGYLVGSAVLFSLKNGGSGIVALCATKPELCKNAKFVLNAINQAQQIFSVGQCVYYSVTNDLEKAQDCIINLYAQSLISGVQEPQAVKDASRSITQLSDDELKLVALYGDDALSLLDKYGDEAANIIGTYGRDGIELLNNYGDDALSLLDKYGVKAVDIIGAYGRDGIELLNNYGDDAAELILKYQTPAVNLLKGSSDPAKTIEELKIITPNLKPEVAELAIEQGGSAIKALSYWGAADLATYGDELVMRASSDADAIARATKIVNQVQSIEDLNKPEVASALRAIASDSTMTIGQGDHFVIGKWDNGLNGGYANEALVNGGKIYYTNPKVSELINSIDDKKLQDEIYKKINQFAIQPAIDEHLPFELTLSGMPTNKIEIITSAIEQIATGNIDNAKIILQKGGVDYSSVFEELEILNANGYNCKLIGGSFIWQFP